MSVNQITVAVPLSLHVDGRLVPPHTPVTLDFAEGHSLVARFGGKIVVPEGPAEGADGMKGAPVKAASDAGDADTDAALDATLPSGRRR